MLAPFIPALYFTEVLIILRSKGTVSGILKDPPFKDGNALFTTVALNLLSDQKCERYCCFSRLKNV